MNKYIASLALVALVGLTANAQTNTLATPSGLLETKEADVAFGGYELTLGAAGETLNEKSYFGLDLSLGTNPFEQRPELWFTLVQSLYWEPSFAGSTDVYVDWYWDILPSIFNENLGVNTGWYGGILYDTQGSDNVWRTGPEITFQYYTSDTAFIYAGVNYDVFRSDGNEGGWAYSFGIGIAF